MSMEYSDSKQPPKSLWNFQLTSYQNNSERTGYQATLESSTARDPENIKVTFVGTQKIVQWIRILTTYERNVVMLYFQPLNKFKKVSKSNYSKKQITTIYYYYVEIMMGNKNISSYFYLVHLKLGRLSLNSINLFHHLFIGSHTFFCLEFFTLSLIYYIQQDGSQTTGNS